MSGFQTNNKVVSWLDQRLPIFSMLHHSGIEYPTRDARCDVTLDRMVRL